MQRHEIFPVPIWQFEYKQAETFKETSVPLFKDIEQKNPNSNVKYTMDGYTSFGPITNILEFGECKDLKNFIMGNVVKAVKDLGLEGYCNLTGSWFNINRKYSSHGEHNHIPDTISGIYYVQAEEDDARISFHDQNKSSNWPWKSGVIETSYTKNIISFKPQTGRLYLFPSYITHSVEQQLKDKERISISFNAYVQ